MKLSTILSISFLTIASFCSAQCHVPMTVANIMDGENVPARVGKQLQSKLMNVATKAGVTPSLAGNRFFIAGRFNSDYKDVLPGPPAQTVLNSTLTLYIADAQDHKVFASVDIPCTGVANTDERAYIQCMNVVNPRNKTIVDFVADGSQKIVDYFNQNFPTILKRAQAAQSAREYDEALFILTAIPECCDGYDQAMELVGQIFKQRMDYEGAKLLAEAKAEWAADPTDAGAARAGALLAQIDPLSASYPAAIEFQEQIGKVVKANWDFENVKKYEDEMELKRQRLKAATEVSKSYIEAARAVGVAYGSGPKAPQYNYHVHRW